MRIVAKEWSVAILLVEHRMDVIMSICDIVTVLRTGQILATGEPDAIQADPRVLEAYLGSKHQPHSAVVAR